ncbi:MAG: GNAT family N-acetyltransferase [Gemmatimonadaceae bacterium]|nr:GNAT family N-acetyltransferase [Gemmatimonadaceae bacterium]
MPLTLRPATPDDIPALSALIERSARELSVGYYSPAEIEAAVRYVFGIDTALVRDGTYFVVHADGALAGCGGWSFRRTLYGGDQRPVDTADDAVSRPASPGGDQLQPGVDPAKIRAFFVAPEQARRGVGRFLLDACLDAARAAGFTRAELMATLPGVPFYAALGFAPVREVSDRVPDGTVLRFVLMQRDFARLGR